MKDNLCDDKINVLIVKGFLYDVQIEEYYRKQK